MRAKMRMSIHYSHFVIKSNHRVKSRIGEMMLIWGLQRLQQYNLQLPLTAGFVRMDWNMRKSGGGLLQHFKSGGLTLITWVRADSRPLHIYYFCINLFWDLLLFQDFLLFPLFGCSLLFFLLLMHKTQFRHIWEDNTLFSVSLKEAWV